MKYRNLPNLCYAIREMIGDNGMRVHENWVDHDVPLAWVERATLAEQAATILYNKPLSYFFNPAEIEQLKEDQTLLEGDLNNALNFMASGEHSWMEKLAAKITGGWVLHLMLDELFEGELYATLQ